MSLQATSGEAAVGELRGRDIICFANDWDSDPLSKKHIMTRLSRDNRVLWVNSIGTRRPELSRRDVRRALAKLRDSFGGQKQVARNITVLAPIAIPFHGSKLARLLNQQWLCWSIRRAARQLGFRNMITWTFLPSTAGVAGSLGEDLLIYHCVDEFSEFTGSDKQALLQMEDRLMRQADAVIVSSTPLYEAKEKYNRNTHLVRHGVDVNHFRKACEPETSVPDDLSRISGPIVGFFGLIEDWVDLKMIRALALARPDYSFVFIGKIVADTTVIKDLGNVHMFGKKDYSTLPAYCKGFNVAILPFTVNPLTIAANPLKLREYLAAGLPVVSTAIPEAERLGSLIRIANDAEEFLRHLDDCLKRNPSGPHLSASSAMNEETWDEKVREMCVIVGQTEFERSRKSISALKVGDKVIQGAAE